MDKFSYSPKARDKVYSSSTVDDFQNKIAEKIGNIIGNDGVLSSGHDGTHLFDVFADSSASSEFNDHLVNENFSNQFNNGVFGDEYPNHYNIEYANNENLISNVNDNFRYLSPNILQSEHNYLLKTGKSIASKIKNKYQNFDAILKKISTILDERSSYIKKIMSECRDENLYSSLTDELNRIDFEYKQLTNCRFGLFNELSKWEDKVNQIFIDAKDSHDKFISDLKELSSNIIKNEIIEENKNKITNTLKNINDEIAAIDIELVNKQFKLDQLMMQQNNAFSTNNIDVNDIQKLNIECENLVNKKNLLKYKADDLKKELFEDLYSLNEQHENVNSLVHNHIQKLIFYYDSLVQCGNEISEAREKLVNNDVNSEYLELFNPIFEYVNARSIEIDNILQSIDENLSYAIDRIDPLYASYFKNNGELTHVKNEKECLELQLNALDILKQEFIAKIDDLINQLQTKMSDVQKLIDNSNKNDWFQNFAFGTEKNPLNFDKFFDEKNNVLTDVKHFLNSKRKEIDKLLLDYRLNNSKKNHDIGNDINDVVLNLQNLKVRIDNELKNLNELNHISLNSLLNIQNDISLILTSLKSKMAINSQQSDLNEFLISLDKNFKNLLLDFDNQINLRIKKIENKFSFFKTISKKINLNINSSKEKLNSFYSKIQNDLSSLEIKKIKSELNLIKKQISDVDSKNDLFLNQIDSINNLISSIEKDINDFENEINKINNLKKSNLENELIIDDKSNKKFLNLFLAMNDFVFKRNSVNQELKKSLNKSEVDLSNIFSKDLSNDLDLLNSYQNNFDTYWHNFNSKLNDYKLVLSNFKSQINDLKTKNHPSFLKKNKENFALINEVNALVNQMQEKKENFFNDMSQIYEKINNKHNQINSQANVLFDKFNSLQDDSNLFVDEEKNKLLKEIQQEQKNLIEEKQKLLNERNFLTQKLKNYENNLISQEKKFIDNEIKEQDSLNYKNKNKCDSEMNEIKNMISSLLSNISNFEKIKQKEINDIKNEYLELKKYNEENERIRQNLQNDIYKFNLDKNFNNPNYSENELNKKINHFKKWQKKIDLNDQKLELKRTLLMNSINRIIDQLAYDDFEDHKLDINNNNYELEIKQKLCDDEIKSIFNKLKKSSKNFTADQKQTIQNIHHEYLDLLSFQREVNLRINKLKDDISNFQNNGLNNISNDHSTQSFASLENKCKKINDFKLDISRKQAKILSDLRNFQINLINYNNNNADFFIDENEQLEKGIDYDAKKQLSIERSNLKKINDQLLRKQDELINKEEQLNEDRNHLINEIKEMKNYLFKHSERIDNFKNFDKFQQISNWNRKNDEINEIFHRLESKRNYLDANINSEFNRLRHEKYDLDNQQTELNYLLKRINHDFERLNQMKYQDLITKEKYESEFNALKTNSKDLEYRFNKLEENHNQLLYYLRFLEQKASEKEQMIQNEKVRLQHDNRSKELETEHSNLRKMSNKLAEKEKELIKKEDQLMNERHHIFDEINKMKNYLFEQNEKINDFKAFNKLKEEEQNKQNNEINKILHKLELKKSQFDADVSNEINRLRHEQVNLDNRQKELDSQSKKIDDDFQKLKHLKHQTLITKERYESELNALKASSANLDRRSNELEENRSRILNYLKSLEHKVSEKEQMIENERLRLQQVSLQQDNRSKELEKALNDLNVQRKEFDIKRNEELEKINQKQEKNEQKELELNRRIKQFKEESSKLNNKKNSIFNDKLRLKNQYDECLALKDAILNEQKKLEKHKNATIENLKKFNEELHGKKAKLRSFYNKVCKLNHEQKLKQQEIDFSIKKHNDEIEKFNKMRDEFNDKQKNLEKEQKDKIQYLNNFYKSLLKRELNLKKIHQDLITSEKELNDKLKKFEIEKEKIIELSTNKEEKKKQIYRCNKHLTTGDNDMSNFDFNNCPNCQVHNQQHYQKPICSNNYGVVPNANFVDPLIQMQRLVQRQQIQMLKQEHKYEMQEANRQRVELEKKLHDLIELQHNQLKEKSSTQHGYDKNFANGGNEDESINRLIHSLAYNTQVKFKKIEDALSEIKKVNENKFVQQNQEAFRNTQNENIENLKNTLLINDIKDAISSEVSQLKNEQNSLIGNYLKKDQERVKEMQAKEHQMKEMMLDMRKAFNEQLNLLKNDKKMLADQVLHYKEMLNNNLSNSNSDKNDALHEAKIILDETKNILAKERERYSKEREQIIRDGYLNDMLKKNEAKNIQNEKQMQIQKLTDEIKNIKDLLDNN
ncbi:hypothetical protein [Mycoplasmoides alvi]|uniref:hypothetical protein n=1 Tax=Mycoplasmoides alvi TaxID=78580 RepID=UPI00051ADC46|nr:hypothetical protein [Mycoplasmoides alvi]